MLNSFDCNSSTFLSNDVQEPRIVIHPDEVAEKFLEACLRAEMEWIVSRDMGIKFEEKAVYVSN